ncbi:hypothetical protein QCA50_004581 [Cerrena zonata]|uniref:Uncharacterized protein n=1 Tax=Cerrena zonata TaxID=2478898 RepID=A0AAW0GI21_9APHY
MGPMTLKPSPLNLARRRWAPSPSRSRQNTVSRSTSRSLTVRAVRSPSPPPRFPPPLISMGSMPLYKARARLLHQPSVASASIGYFSGDSDDEEQWPHSSEDDDMEPYHADDGVKLEYAESEHTFDNNAPSNFDMVDADSERIVERLIALPGSSSPSSLGDSRSPRSQSPRLPSPDYSPGLAWKRTVLLPTDEPCNIPKAVKPPIAIPPFPPASPTKLIYAGWDTSSSDIDPI